MAPVLRNARIGFITRQPAPALSTVTDGNGAIM